MTTFKTMDPAKSITVGARRADTCSVAAGVAGEDAKEAGCDFAGAWLGVAVVADLRVDTVL
jgi:hypothetical protein